MTSQFIFCIRRAALQSLQAKPNDEGILEAFFLNTTAFGLNAKDY